MLKKLSTVLILVMFYLPVNAQILISLLLGDKLNSDQLEFGLDGGLNLSNQTGLNQGSRSSNFNLGFYFDFKIKQTPWMLHTGVIVKSNISVANLTVYSLSNASLDSSFNGGSVRRKLSYFHVPILAKYNFKNHLYVELGPQLALFYKGIDEFENTINSNELHYENDVTQAYKRIDAGVTAGIGYRLLGGNGMNLGMRYYYGLIDVFKNNSASAAYNRSLYFTVGIPIGASTAKQPVN